MNFPNFLSLFRIFLIIPLIYFISELSISSSNRYWALFIILLAGISDYLDGFYARKFNRESELGKVLDPLADKLFVGVSFFFLYLYNEITLYFLILILVRDIFILLGGYYIKRRYNKILQSNLLGKITFSFIVLFLIIVILNIDNNHWFYKLFYYSSVLLSFISIAGYALRAYEIRRWGKK